LDDYIIINFAKSFEIIDVQQISIKLKFDVIS